MIIDRNNNISSRNHKRNILKYHLHVLFSVVFCIAHLNVISLIWFIKNELLCTFKIKSAQKCEQIKTTWSAVAVVETTTEA